MINPETARQLKDAGLIWKPKTGDTFIPEDFPDEVFVTSGGREPGDVWLPDIEGFGRFNVAACGLIKGGIEND